MANPSPENTEQFRHSKEGVEATFSFADSGLLDELELLFLAPGEPGRHSILSKKND
jgi:hypothetical protein